MKNYTAALAIGIAMIAMSSFAGTGKSFKEEITIVEEPIQWWNANLSTGWDSLYMFRGVNVLRNGKSYGSSIYWTDLSVQFNLTKNDSLTIGSWLGFGVDDTDYKEYDASVSYTHTFGSLSLSLGYTFYYIFSNPSNAFSHELNVGAAYEFDLGFMSLTPGINYYFNIGPDINNKGFAKEASSYLEIRLDGNVPIYKEILAAAPWISFGTNFRYNTDSSGNPFHGTNNLEFGLSLPIQVNKFISVSPYVAYSLVISPNGLLDTRRNTVWSGGSVNFSF
jgi:hypothetical protein